MQALMRMRFGSYTFLQNPAQLQVENRALQQEERLLSGGVCVTPAGRRATVITGKGWWYGGRALEMAQVLRRLLLPGQAHWLFAPGAEPMRAYLTRFDYTCTTARDGVQYSFTFTEDCDPAPRYAPYGSTRVRQGENAFDIAARTGVSVDTIVALNRLASAHLRETPVYAPYGYAANVPAGAQVLLLSGGEDGAVVAGARMGNADLAPGEVELRGPGGAVVRLCRDGTVRINGLVINEKGEIEP